MTQPGLLNEQWTHGPDRTKNEQCTHNQLHSLVAPSLFGTCPGIGPGPCCSVWSGMVPFYSGFLSCPHLLYVPPSTGARQHARPCQYQVHALETILPEPASIAPGLPRQVMHF